MLVLHTSDPGYTYHIVLEYVNVISPPKHPCLGAVISYCCHVTDIVVTLSCSKLSRDVLMVLRMVKKITGMFPGQNYCGK